jgi:hypothetical protein
VHSPSGDEAEWADRLHAANLCPKILMYQTPSASRATDPLGKTTCTPYWTDALNHPDWFLTDQFGRRLVGRGYADQYLMNPGGASYQRACLENDGGAEAS